MQERDPNKALFSLLILIVLILPGCLAPTPSIGTPSLGVSPTATFTRTSAPTKTPTATETVTPSATAVASATALPTIEIGPRSTLDPSAELPIITEIQMTSETSGWAFASRGEYVLVLNTSDGGISWRDVTPPIESWSAHIEQNEFYVPRIGEGFFLDKDRAWISTLLVEKGGPQDAFTAKVMLSTNDSGATWRMIKLPPGGKGVGYGRFVEFINPMHGWFVVYGHPGAGAGYTGLYRTRDGGESWEIALDTLGTPSGSYRARDLAFGDPTTGVMTFKQFGWYTPLRISWTQDSGMTWETQYLPKPEDPSTSDPTISYFECGSAFPHAFSKLAVALLVECRMVKDTGSNTNKFIYSNFIYSTQDGGINWESFPAPSGHLYLLNPSSGWMLGEEIHLTEDGGKTWTKINEVVWQGQFNFIDAHHGWAVAKNDDEIALVKTENGGRSWYIVEPQLVP